jgi:hypothetical protein
MRNVSAGLFILGILMVYWAFKFYFRFAKRMESKNPELNGSNFNFSGRNNDPEFNKLSFIQWGIVIFLVLFVGGILLALLSLLSLVELKTN